MWSRVCKLCASLALTRALAELTVDASAFSRVVLAEQTTLTGEEILQ